MDESGNTGDLSLSGPKLDFGGQPVFSLACLGFPDEENIKSDLIRLKKKHNIQANEVKLLRLLKRKPDFIIESVDHFFNSLRLPFFIEVVDKKYQLAVIISNYLIWPPYFNIEESPKTIALKNIFADFIYYNISKDFLYRFIQSMKAPSNEKIDQIFTLLKSEISNSNHVLTKSLLELVDESEDDFRLIKGQDGEFAYKRFLPIPDEGKRGQTVWILPHYSCFTNIYARINLYLSRNISSCKIFHDEQVHFDQIILDAKSQSENNPIPFDITPFSDYSFSQSANLLFKTSIDDPGIQIADILAGLSMRWYLNNLNNEPQTGPLHEAIDILLDHVDPAHGIGINLVSTHNAACALFGESGYSNISLAERTLFT